VPDGGWSRFFAAQLPLTRSQPGPTALESVMHRVDCSRRVRSRHRRQAIVRKRIAHLLGPLFFGLPFYAILRSDSGAWNPARGVCPLRSGGRRRGCAPAYNRRERTIEARIERHVLVVIVEERIVEHDLRLMTEKAREGGEAPECRGRGFSEAKPRALSESGASRVFSSSSGIASIFASARRYRSMASKIGSGFSSTVGVVDAKAAFSMGKSPFNTLDKGQL
jgi:hypothetical protein